MRRMMQFGTPRVCRNAPPDDRGLPDLSFAFYDRMVLFDHIRKTILVVAQAHVRPGRDPRVAYQRRATGSTNWSIGWPGPVLSWDCATSTRIRRSR